MRTNMRPLSNIQRTNHNVNRSVSAINWTVFNSLDSAWYWKLSNKTTATSIRSKTHTCLTDLFNHIPHTNRATISVQNASSIKFPNHVSFGRVSDIKNEKKRRIKVKNAHGSWFDQLAVPLRCTRRTSNCLPYHIIILGNLVA